MKTNYEAFKQLIIASVENVDSVYSDLKDADHRDHLLEREDVELILRVMGRTHEILYSKGKSRPV